MSAPGTVAGIPVASPSGSTSPLTERRFVVYGFGVTGAAVARALVVRGLEVVACDDRLDAAKAAAAAGLGIELVSKPSADDLAARVAWADAVVPAPGLPESHPLFGAVAAAQRPVLSEFDLAAAWDARPLLSITGTNGKTTVTMMVTEMLAASGCRAAAVGNTDVPLIAAIDDPDLDVFVVESSSFRLGHTRRFRPAAATWLNFAPDHLDVHADLDVYEGAKARSWTDLDSSSVAVANLDDAVVARHIGGGARFVTFGLDRAPSGWEFPHLSAVGGALIAPDGSVISRGESLPRRLPHDLANALAATATAVAGGASLDAVRSVLASFEGLPHRVQYVASIDGVSYFDDSKATAPHAVFAAVRAFPHVVLIAGGRNKGLDLSVLGALGAHVRAVVGIGEAAGEVIAAFPDRPGTAAATMEEAVAAAARLAQPGDAVVLSPGCASFDWYRNYGERGDHFAEIVRARQAGGNP
ncbi:MAG TPA: UDP-N-acetylmuramoyl-L-alanine--D-glutamate ligase [Microthrixaceae bacterium]|nr:UDP-N-acetylmuramoyl-L-alanine--D-glutamate ligase [Microthrixaceae bacterium]HMT61175.1 UDP-N-acetylmuramoyl-L-alanine--D-glutamate ligase [Microthrixaceae bacterium]